MVELLNPAAAAEERRDVANNQSPELEKVNWRTDPALRRLYILSFFGLMIASATTGYDG